MSTDWDNVAMVFKSNNKNSVNILLNNICFLCDS